MTGREEREKERVFGEFAWGRVSWVVRMGCALNMPCCRMKFSQAQMCTNDSFHGRLKSDIKTERNVCAHTQMRTQWPPFSLCLEGLQGWLRVATIMSALQLLCCLGQGACACACVYVRAYVLIDGCACPKQVHGDREAAWHGDMRSVTAANQKHQAHLAAQSTI